MNFDKVVTYEFNYLIVLTMIAVCWLVGAGRDTQRRHEAGLGVQALTAH